MKIYALDSSTEDFQSLINSLAEKVSIDLFDDFETLLGEVEDDCKGVLLDFDVETRKKNKLISKLKKSYPDMNVFLLANSLDAKKMTKHQKSKTGAHVYFQTPLDDDLLESLIEPFIDLAGEGEMRAEEVLKDHETKSNISELASDVSKTIDGAFETAFMEEYSGPENNSTENDLENISLDAAGGDDATDDAAEFSLDEMSLDESEGDATEFSLDEDDGTDFSLDESETKSEDDATEFSLGDNENDGTEFSLDEDDNSSEEKWNDQEELSLSDENDDEPVNNTVFPDEDDLSFPEMDLASMQEEDSNANESSDIGVQEMELSDSSDLVELSDLSEQDVVAKVDSSDDMELSLGDDDIEFSLGGSDEVESAEVDRNEISLGGDEAQEMDLSEDSEEDQGLVISSDDTSASQVFKLDETQDKIKLEEESEVEKVEEPHAEDSVGIQLGSDQEDDSVGDMNTNVGLITGMDDELSLTEDDGEEITKTQMNLSVNMPDSKFDDSKQDDIGDLLSGFDDDDDESNSEDLESTNTGVTIQGITMTEVETDDVSANETGITMKHPVEVENDQNSGDTKTSIDMLEGSLTSIHLPEAPDFSETVEKKLQEIDNLIDDDNDFEEDKTMVVNREELETNFYSNQGISDETTIIKQNPDNQNTGADRTLVASVSEDLKSDHRSYVQSHDEELIRLGETIKSLRQDREELQHKLSDYENRDEGENRALFDLQAQLDEKNIELIVIKKRMDKQIDDLRFQLDIALDKKELISRQNEKNNQEIEKLSRQKKLDINKIRARERELEEKLEMLRGDAEVQIRNRDQKILELKRRIDTLEFDIENSHVKEKQSIDGQMDLQDKMDRVIKTLRGAIGHLEDDYGVDERKANIKKNLDV